MKTFGLFTKNSKEMISTTKSDSLQEATQFFIERKKMSDEDFEKIFMVEESVSKRTPKSHFYKGEDGKTKYFHP